MKPMNRVDDRLAHRAAGRRVATALGAGLATLSFFTLSAPCTAAESINGLGTAFRPQAGSNAPAGVAGGADVGGSANLPGVRVVVWGAAKPLASIDGRVVRVGDIVNGMRVARINEQGVVLVGEDGTEERMTINPPSIVKQMQPAKAAHVSKGDGR